MLDINKKREELLDSYELIRENEHFKKIVKFYTETSVLEKTQSIANSSESRPELFEDIICASKFESFINNLEAAFESRNGGNTDDEYSDFDNQIV